MPRTKMDYSSSSKDVYNRFCEKYPDIEINYKEWKSVLKAYNTAYRDHLIKTGDKVKMPWGIGPFAVSKKKARKFVMCRDGVERIRLPIDWAKTRATGKRVYHLNLHSNGYVYKWYWFVQESRIPQAGVWVFRPSRDVSRAIKAVADDPKYVDVYKQWGRR
jgi:hypothetical protein